MTTFEIESIRGLGMKDFGKAGYGLDTSGEDGGPLLREWPGLFGVFQPDVINVFTYKGEVSLLSGAGLVVANFGLLLESVAIS